MKKIAFKFLNSEHAPLLLAGKLKFGRLKYYRLLEAVTGDHWIGDIAEGSVTNLITHAVVDDSTPPAMRESIRQSGIAVEGGGGVTITNHRHINNVEAFVFCLSLGELQSLAKTMCDGVGNYDTGICFEDLDGLQASIWEHGVLEDGKAVKDVFADIASAPVKYGSTEFELTTLGPIDASPFRKRELYSAQAEYRIALFPRLYIDSDSITISIPAQTASSRACYHAPRTAAPSEVRTSNSAAVSQNDAVAELFDILGKMRSRRENLYRTLTSAKTAREIGLSVSNQEVQEYREKYQPRLAKAYWILRQSGHRNNSIDDILVAQHVNGGAITGLLFDLESYLKSLPAEIGGGLPKK